MSCCGQGRRAAARAHPASPAPPAPRDDTPEPEPTARVTVEYRGRAPALYRSRDGGRLYAFSPGRRIRRLPRGDAQLLLRSPLFRLGDK
jgi:hypothetical protein